jgi:hypothetical protein
VIPAVRDYWTSWMTRLTSNMISDLTLVPAVVLFGLSGVSWIGKATFASFREIESFLVPV